MELEKETLESQPSDNVDNMEETLHSPREENHKFPPKEYSKNPREEHFENPPKEHSKNPPKENFENSTEDNSKNLLK